MGERTFKATLRLAWVSSAAAYTGCAAFAVVGPYLGGERVLADPYFFNAMVLNGLVLLVLKPRTFNEPPA